MRLEITVTLITVEYVGAEILYVANEYGIKWKCAVHFKAIF